MSEAGALLEAENTLAQRRRERGAAVLDGTPIDHSGVAEAEAALDALLESERVAADRQRQLAAEQESERRSRLLAQISSEEVQYLARVGLAEQAARDLATNLKAALAHADTIRTAKALRGDKPSTALQATEISRRLSERISLQLRNIVHPIRFGGIRLHTGALEASAIDHRWAEKEKGQIQ